MKHMLGILLMQVLPIQPPHLAFIKILSFFETHSELFENQVESIVAILGVDGQCFNHYPKF